MSEASNDGLSYKDAGVDIDAGNALVANIKSVARRTRRPEVLGGLGGFALPLLFAWAKVKTGEPESTFLVLLASALVSLIWLHLVVIKMRRDERRHTTATIDTDTTTKGAI